MEFTNGGSGVSIEQTFDDINCGQVFFYVVPPYMIGGYYLKEFKLLILEGLVTSLV